MKRTPLKRTTALRRATQPLRRESKLRSRKWRKRPTDQALAAKVRRAVLSGANRCLGSSFSSVPCSGPLDPCHLIPAQALRKRGLSEAVAYDPRNGVAMCRAHHARSDSGKERVPAALVPLAARSFAREHGLDHLLETLYGAEA